MSPTTTSSRRLMSSTPRSPWPSNGSLKTSTTMTSPSARRSQNACRRRADHSEEEGLSCCLSSSSMSHDRTRKPVVCRDKSHEQGQEIQRQNSESEQIRTLLYREMGANPRWLPSRDSKTRTPVWLWPKKYNKNWVKRSSFEWNDRVEKRRTLSCSSRRRTTSTKIINFFMNSHWSKTGIFVKLMRKVMTWRNWRTFRVPPSTKLQEEDWSKIKILSSNSQARYKNCKMKMIVWMVQEIFNQDAESVRSGHFHRTSQPVSFPTSSSSWWNAKPFSGNAEPQRWAAKHLGHAWYLGKRFLQIQPASSSAPYPQDLNQWSSSIEKPLHSSTVEKSERRRQDQDQRCQSGPSAKDSVIFSGGDSSNNYGADQQRLQISVHHFDKFPTPATFACWKIRFKTEVRTCSQFPTEAMQWIKEVEMVDSADDF